MITITGEIFKSHLEQSSEMGAATTNGLTDEQIAKAILGSRNWGADNANRVPQGVTLIADFTGTTITPADFQKAKSPFVRSFMADKYENGQVVKSPDGKTVQEPRPYNVIPVVDSESGTLYELGCATLFAKFIDDTDTPRRSSFSGNVDQDLVIAMNARNITKEQHLEMFCKLISGKRLEIVVNSFPDKGRTRIEGEAYPATKIATVKFS